MQISRKKLVKIAFEAIARTEAETQPLSRSDKNHLLYAACTMPQVALGAWALNNNCGCLVGTMLLNDQASIVGQYTTEADPLYVQIENAMVPGHSLWNVGLLFDDILRAYLADKYNDGDPDSLDSQPVDVVDA